MGDASLLFEPEVALLQHLLDAVRCEELRIGSKFGGFAGHGFGSVFAEFGDLALPVGIRPRAARAIEPILLIDLPQRAHAAGGSHLTQTVPRRFVDRSESGCCFVPLDVPRTFLLEGRLCAGNALREVRLGRRRFASVHLSRRAVLVVRMLVHGLLSTLESRAFRHFERAYFDRCTRSHVSMLTSETARKA